MAEKLIFPIGFDLETGSKEALKNWDTVQQQLQQQFNKKPIKLKVELDTKGVGLKDLNEYIRLSKEAEQATKNAAAAAKRAADVRKKNAQATKSEADARVAQATVEDRILQKKLQTELTTLRLANAKDRDKNATNAQNAAYRTQEGLVTRLIQRFAVYMSLYQVIGFLKNIQAVTAEFELQRVSLGATIGSVERASSLFEQNKEAAVKSPFEIKDLVTYTKQLAAYRIETEELFDTTMKLADISAGLGVGMERIILAYGQIRATGYLRASEVRQLTEAGIPIVEELAKKMSILRNETYSAADVMGLISERAISFELVKEVFDDMTSAGGMFYKMQEKQSETLYGQWMNMKDAISIMFDEIGRTPEVMAFMKELANGVKLLAENWRNVWEVMKTLGLAYGGYIAIQKTVIALDKVAVAQSTMLSNARARQAALNAKLLVLKKNNNIVTRLQIMQTNLLRAANLKLMRSTSLLSRAWNRLKIAFLSNPFGIAATAILSMLTVMQLFMDATEDFAEKTESNVDIYKHIEDTKKYIKDFKSKEALLPIVSELDTLQQKTSLTADEQKRYNELIDKLALTAPELFQKISAVQGGLKGALEAENAEIKKELMERLKFLKEYLPTLQGVINEARDKITYGFSSAKFKYDTKFGDLYRGIAPALNFLRKNFRVPGLDLPNFERDANAIEKVALSEAERLELQNKIVESKEKELAVLKEISDLEITLGVKEPPALTGWRAQVASFSKDGIALFWRGEIENFSNLNAVLEEAAKKYKDAKEASDRYAQALKALGKKQGVEDQKDEIEKTKKRVDITKDLSYALLEYYGALSLLDSKKKPEDSRLSDLKDQINDLTNAYKKYLELRKYMQKEEALENIDILFPSLKGFEPTYENMVKRLEQLRDDVRAKLAKSPKDKTLIDMSREIEKSLANVKFDNIKTTLEKKITQLSEDVSKTKAAKEFYDKIFGITGDRDLSATFTMSVYGESGDELAERTVKQLKAAFEGIDLSEAINYNNFQVDWKKVADIYKAHQEDMLEANRKTAESLIKNAQEVSAEQIQQWVKELEQVKSYADKRVELARQTAERIREIEQSDIPQEQKDTLTEQYRKREEEQASKLQYEAFKDSPAYVEMFNNLDNASVKMLEHLRDKLQDLQSEWKNLDPTQLKELQSRLNAIDEQLASRNPFKALANSIKEYYEQRKQGSRADAEKALAGALQRQADAYALLDERIKDVNSAQEQYDQIRAQEGDDSLITMVYKDQLEIAQDQLKTQQKITDETDEAVDKAQKLVSAWDKIKAGGRQAFAGIDEFVQAVGQSATQIYEAFGGFGGDEADAEYFDSMVQGVSDLSTGIANIASGNPVQVIQGIGQAVSGISNLFTAGTVRKANKEIARQQEILEGLEYAYGRLENATKDALGSDYIKNYQERLRNLTAQQNAYLKQAEAERSKGKKADKAKIKEYENAARDTADEIKDMHGELSEYFLGMGLTDAARELARSWIEAKKEIGDATKAIEERIAEMIENLVLEAGAVEIAKRVMQPFYDEVERLANDVDGLTTNEIVTLAKMIPQLSEDMNVGLSNYFETLKASGYDITKTASDLTGISKDIASASEESILGLAAGINTQNFYISQIHANVALITQWVQSGGMVTQGVNVSDLITLQNQHLSHLPNIAANTAATLTECRSILAQTTRIADNLNRVITPKGTKGAYSLNTSL